MKSAHIRSKPTSSHSMQRAAGNVKPLMSKKYDSNKRNRINKFYNNRLNGFFKYSKHEQKSNSGSNNGSNENLPSGSFDKKPDASNSRVGEGAEADGGAASAKPKPEEPHDSSF